MRSGVPGSLVGDGVVSSSDGGFPIGAISPAAVRTEGLSKRFGTTTAVDELDLEVGAGEVFGFLGPNGAWKSTPVRLLLGLLRATAGRAQIFGIDAADAVAAHQHLAYVPADVALWPNLTGAETLALLGNLGSAGYRPARTGPSWSAVRPAGRPPVRHVLDW